MAQRKDGISIIVGHESLLKLQEKGKKRSGGTRENVVSLENHLSALERKRHRCGSILRPWPSRRSRYSFREPMEGCLLPKVRQQANYITSSIKNHLCLSFSLPLNLQLPFFYRGGTFDLSSQHDGPSRLASGLRLERSSDGPMSKLLVSPDSKGFW